MRNPDAVDICFCHTCDAMSVLHEILATKRDEVTLLHQPQTRDAIRRAALDAPPARGFTERLRVRAREAGRLGVVAEI